MFRHALIIIGVLVCATPALADIPYQPITPMDIPGNSIQSELPSTELQKAQIAFRKYQARTQQSQARSPHSLQTAVANIPDVTVKTTSGQQIDTKQLYQFVNQLEVVLNKHNKTLRNPQLGSKIDLTPYLSELSLPTYGPAVVPPKYVQPQVSTQQSATVVLPRQPPSTEAYPTCPPASPPKAVDIQKAWKSINSLPSGTLSSAQKLQYRCALDFESQLTASESGSPHGPSSDTFHLAPIQLIGSPDKKNSASAFMTSAISYDATTRTLAYQGDLEGKFLDHALPLSTLNLSVITPAGQDPSAKVLVTIGSVTAYQATGSWKNLKFSTGGSSGNPQTTALFAPFAEHWGVFTFEIDGTVSYAINGTVQTSGLGALIDVSPTLDILITGGLQANGIVVSGGLTGHLHLAKVAGDFGAMAVVFGDTTSLDPTVTNTPLVLVAAPTLSYSGSFLTGDLHATLTVALIGKVLSATIATWPGQSFSSPPGNTTWTVYPLTSSH